MGTFSARSATGEDRTTVTVSGDIDIATAPQFQGELVAAVAAGLPVDVDCSGVAFIDSMGLRSLLHAVEQAEAEGVELRLTALSPQMTRILDLAGLAGFFRSAQAGAGVVED